MVFMNCAKSIRYMNNQFSKNKSSPLADNIRPKSIDDVVGQKHLLAKGKPLRNIIESGFVPNMIFYGPPGVGKTTVASIIAQRTNKTLHKLNGTTTSIADIQQIIGELDTFHAQNGILLYLDEIQYLNKKQQQSLLEFMENGKITLIASTTENPYFYIYKAILSRATVFEFKQVDKSDIKSAIMRAFEHLKKQYGNSDISIDNDALDLLSETSCGDVRKSLNLLELCFVTHVNNSNVISYDMVNDIGSFGSSQFDRSGDDHYDLLSAFQRSIRGSDPNAAIYYLARLLQSGDLASVCRRLSVCVCEDIGLAYPQIIPIVKSCIDIAFQVGLPEARIPLADAVILASTAPKSNSAYLAINKATNDIESGKIYPIPRTLQNKHFDGDDVKNKGQFYLYPHDYENHWVNQQYLPDMLKNEVYYRPDNNKNETAFRKYLDKITGKL